MIIPLSLAVKSPEMLSKKIYTLVVSGEDSVNNSLNNSLNIEDLSKGKFFSQIEVKLRLYLIINT